MRHLHILINFIRVFKYLGLFQILKFYTLQKNKTSQFKIKNYKNIFFLRGATSDSWVFDMNIIREEYKVFMPIASPKTILDAGANIGTASRFFSNQFPDAKIIAIEPDSENYEILIKNTQNNKNIQCLKGGLWSSDTKLSIVNDNEWKYAIRVKEDVLEGKINAFSIHGVMKMQGWDFIDILKLDIEGSEVEILSKHLELWVDKIGMLIIELHPGLDEKCTRVLFEAFSNKDFSLKWSGENLALIFKNQNN